jgi:heme O synthase-like polyprenyltransferase
MFSKETTNKVTDFFSSLGIELYILLPIVALLSFLIFDLKKIRHWDEQTNNEKRFIYSSILVYIVVIIGSIINFLSSTK